MSDIVLRAHLKLDVRHRRCGNTYRPTAYHCSLYLMFVTVVTSRVHLMCTWFLAVVTGPLGVFASVRSPLCSRAHLVSDIGTITGQTLCLTLSRGRT